MTARLDIEYDGTDFFGWAIQPEVRTVQGEVERALAIIARRPLRLTVAGRTDRGVHATGQVASHEGAPVRAHQLNAILPRDVRIVASGPAAEGFDARHDAVARAYEYRLFTRRTASALQHRHELHFSRPLHEAALHACAAALPGSHDFRAFTPTETDHKSFRRHVHRAGWSRDGDHLTFAIEGNAFMRNMVRALVGTMLDVALGRRDIASFVALLDGAHRREAGTTAPPHGLTLVGVRY